MSRFSERKFSAPTEEAPPNPMDGVANMADCMLVLAVGIMLALVIHWEVDIGGSGMTTDGVGANESAIPAELEPQKDENDTNTGEGEWQDLGSGRVYYDPATEQYYVIPEE